MRIATLLVFAAILVASAATAFTQTPPSDPVALATEGRAALQERRFADALAAFTDASRLLPRNASFHLGAGIAAFMLGQNQDAQASFERALALQPGNVSAASWLGQLHYREGRLEEAIATYEAVLKRSPGSREVEQQVAEWRKEAQLQARFYTSRGAHFAVLFEGPADEAIARRVVERLEAAYWRIGAALTAYPPQPITVVLYTREQFRDITRLPSWTAAAYDGRIRLPIRGGLEQIEELDRVLGHEFVHAVVAMLGGRNVPVWVNEGLATVFEPGGATDAAAVLARVNGRPPLEQLHRSFFRLSDDQAQIAYAYSARAVQRIIELRGASAVVALLKDLAQGAQFETAFHQRIAMRYDDFQAMMARE